MSLLSVQDLDVRHGLLRAVRGVSFDLGKGDVLALVGANGAGKTTLLRSLAGAHRSSAGRVLLNGQDVTAMPSHIRVARGVALVPEGRRLFANMTVEDNLLLGKTAGRPGEWTVERVFAAFPNLEARRRAKAGTLSGGEQQATAIGRALMSNPDILLIDEVSLGLSPLVVDRVYAQLRALLSFGTTLILVEQDLGRALGMASRVICMLEGSFVLDGPVAGVSRDRITDAYFGLKRSSPGRMAL